MAIGIDPTVDYAFKLMLGNPAHPNVTIHFLNSILGVQPRITQVEYLNPFLGKQTDDDKLSILDILATDEHGRRLNIEVQTSLPAGLSERLLFYTSSLYVEQLNEGMNYTELRPAISICILTKSLFSESSSLHLDFRLRETSGLQLTDGLQVHLLELPKLRVVEQTVSNATPTERWAYFLRNAAQLSPNEIARLFPDKEITEAAGVLEMISRTPEQTRLYNARLKFQRDDAARLEYALTEGRQRGVQEGLEVGRQVGMQEGRQAGMQEGRQAGMQEGRQEGRQQGVLIGRITLLQQLLGIPESSLDELSGQAEAQLTEMLNQLQQQIRNRPQ